MSHHQNTSGFMIMCKHGLLHFNVVLKHLVPSFTNVIEHTSWRQETSSWLSYMHTRLTRRLEIHISTDNRERLLPSVQVIDTTGAVELKMREKAALELSGRTSKQDFAELASKGALNFQVS